MKKIYFILTALISCSQMQSQLFEAVPNSGFQGVFFGDCATADFNNDGKTDFIISGAKPGYTGFTAIYENNNGSFAANTIAQLDQLMYSAIAVGDLNGDNRNDIIVTGTTTTGTAETVFVIYYNNGDGSFSKDNTTGIVGVNFGSLQVADFDGDGRKDILVNGNPGTEYSTKIYRQGINGTFTDMNANLMGTYFSATKVFDANGDGHPDILVTGYNTAGIPDSKIYLNSGDGTFTEKQNTLTGVYFSSIDVADINNDGHPDLLISGTDTTPKQTLIIYTNDGSGNFTEMENNFIGTYNGSSKFVDYNNDGLIDVFSIGSNAAGQNTTLLYKNNGNGTFTQDTAAAASIAGLNMSRAQWFDYDGDGDLDLLTIGFEGGNIAHTTLYKNTTINPVTCSEPGNTTGDTGCVTFTYLGSPVTYTTVRGSDGNIWLQQNLGSSKVAETVNDTDAYGDLFQWGRHDDGHQKRNSTTAAIPTPNNPSGIVSSSVAAEFYVGSPGWWSANALTDKWVGNTPAEASEVNGCDPCKALGNGWKMPTETEWEAIVESQNMANPATAFASVLKLPASGYRSASGALTFVGTRGYYSSATTSSTGSKYLYIGTTIANPSAGAPRGQASAVRCLKYPSAVESPYCNVTVDYDVEPITRVSFAGINNTSSATVNGSPAYENFTAISGTVHAGQSYEIIVEGNTAGAFEHDIRVFIDWNKNGVFDMDSEYYGFSLNPSTGADGVQATGTIAVPSNALMGNTRMRIIKDQWNVYEEGEFDGCLNAYYGQVEDYTLDVQQTLGVIDVVKNAFEIYPNPTHTTATIATESIIKSARVYNQLGQLIIDQTQPVINLSQAPTGIYMIQIEFENGQTAVRKLIKK